LPKDFERCVQSGGVVRTKKLKGGKYIHICFLDGKSYAGEVKKKKSEGSRVDKGKKKKKEDVLKYHPARKLKY